MNKAQEQGIKNEKAVYAALVKAKKPLTRNELIRASKVAEGSLFHVVQRMKDVRRTPGSGGRPMTYSLIVKKR